MVVPRYVAEIRLEIYIFNTVFIGRYMSFWTPLSHGVGTDNNIK